jgi:hypothetical protein
MNRYERCNIPVNSHQQSISLMISRLQRFLDGQSLSNGKPRKLGDYQETGVGQGSVREWDIKNLYDFLLLEHFQFHHPFGNVSQYLELLIKYSSEFFSGNWIEESCSNGNITIKPNDYRKQISWLEPFQRGILATLLWEDKNTLQVIGFWIDKEYRRDELDYTQADIDFFVTLGGYLQKYSVNQFVLESIKKQSRRRPRMLAEMLDAIQLQNSDLFSKHFNEYHKYFDKNECDKDAFLLYKNLNINASIMWNLANLCGLKLPEFPEKIMDRIMTPQSVGLVQ